MELDLAPGKYSLAAECFSHDECELEIIAESAEGRCDVNPSFWASSNACILDACSAKRASRRLLPRVLGCLTVIRHAAANGNSRNRIARARICARGGESRRCIHSIGFLAARRAGN